MAHSGKVSPSHRQTAKASAESQGSGAAGGLQAARHQENCKQMAHPEKVSPSQQQEKESLPTSHLQLTSKDTMTRVWANGEQHYCLVVTDDIFNKWRQIGESQRLTSDMDIAGLLMEHYHNIISREPSGGYCPSCKCLSTFACTKCHTPDFAAQSRRGDDATPRQPVPDGEKNGGEAAGSEMELAEGWVLDQCCQPAAVKVVSQIKVPADKYDDDDLPVTFEVEPEGTELIVKGEREMGKNPAGDADGRKQTQLADASEDPTPQISCPEKGTLANAAGYPPPSSPTKDVKGKAVVCPDCGTQFSKRGSLTMHMRTRHGIGRGPHIPCKHCDKAFFKMDHYKAHLKTHWKRKHGPGTLFACRVCSKAFVKIFDLADHLKSHGPQAKPLEQARSATAGQELSLKLTPPVSGPETPTMPLSVSSSMKDSKGHLFACRVCSKAFANTVDLTDHLKSHGPQAKPLEQARSATADLELTPPVSCHKKTIMPLSSSTKDSKGLLFACRVCRKAFAKIVDLADHLKSHGAQAKPLEQAQAVTADKELTPPVSCSEKPTVPLSIVSSCMKGKPTITLSFSSTKDMKGKAIVCPDCGTHFSKKGSLTMHMRAQHGIGPGPNFSCRFCQKAYFKVDQFKAHLRTHGPFSMLPEEKKKSVSSTKDLRGEGTMASPSSSSSTKVKSLVCPDCGTRLANRGSFSLHRRRIHGVGPGPQFSCGICDKAFYTTSHYKDHIKTHTPGRKPRRAKPISVNAAKTSNRSPSSSSSTEEGLKGKPLVCPDCGTELGNKGALIMHRRRMHGVGQGPQFSCPVCSKAFYTITHYKEHLETHTPHPDRLRAKVCPDCGNRYRTMNGLNAHRRGKHGSGQEPQLSCQICDKAFYNNDTYKAHLDSHQPLAQTQSVAAAAAVAAAASQESSPQVECHEISTSGDAAAKASDRSSTSASTEGSKGGSDSQKRVLCPDCGVQYNKLNTLTLHRRIKHGVGQGPQFSCGVCHKVFFRYPNYQRHLNSHQTTGSHCCHRCGKTFKQERSLKTHLCVDTPKSLKCSVCPKLFSTKKLLQNHEYTHTNEKRSVCHLCGERFKYAGALTAHKKECHNIVHRARMGRPVQDPSAPYPFT